MSTIWGFDGMKNKHNLYRSKDCLKKYCESLREFKVTRRRKEGNDTVNKRIVRIVS